MLTVAAGRSLTALRVGFQNLHAQALGQLGMITSRVDTPVVSGPGPTRRLASAIGPVIGVEGRRTARAASRGSCAAANQPEAAFGLGRPGRIQRAVPTPPPRRTRSSASLACHHPARAPPPCRPEMDLPTSRWPPVHRARARGVDRPARQTESDVGLPADPRRTPQTRTSSRRIDDPARTKAASDTAGTGQSRRHELAAVPACTSIDDVGVRLLPHRLRHHTAPDLRVLRDRDQHPLRPHPRHHNQPRRTLDRTAGSQPDR